jgi:hypothetical protein
MKKYILALYLIVLFAACSKVNIEAPEDFQVTVAKTTYAIADTVQFTLSGNPDYVTFYSGEPHSKYELSGVTTMAADSNILVFSTATTAAGTSTQPLSVNNVSLMASTNFSGNYDSASIRKATWTDISSRAQLAVTNTAVVSGNIRVDDLKPALDTTPLYLAFRYVADTVKTNYLARQWVLSALTFKSYFKDTVYALASNYTSGGFYAVNILNNLNTWAYNNTSSITTGFTFAAPALASQANNDWVVSRPFNLSLYPADLGLQIKNLGDTRLTKYKMTRRFKAPGTYVVTFLAQNQNAEKAAKVVRQITLTITP